MSGRVVVVLGLFSLVGVGSVLLYLLKTSESVRVGPDDGGVSTAVALARPAAAWPVRRQVDASAEANISVDAGAAPGADVSAPRRLVPNRAAKLAPTATGAQ